MTFCTVLLKQRSKHTEHYTKLDKHMSDLKHTLTQQSETSAAQHTRHPLNEGKFFTVSLYQFWHLITQ